MRTIPRRSNQLTPGARSCRLVKDDDVDDAAEGDEAPDGDEEAAETAATARAHLARLAKALAAMDDVSTRRALATMSETNRLEVAVDLQLPKAAIHLGDALVGLVRRKVRSVPPARQLTVAFALCEAVNDETIAALGDRSENPSREDMLAVLPGVIEHHGLPTARLMLASYGASDAPCQAVFSEILETDERFAGAVEPTPLEDEPAGLAPAPAGRDDEAQAEKRVQRKAAKEARRAAEAKKKEAAVTAAAKQKEARRAAKKAGG